ncbi:MAG: bifunctional transaldolase/phosoglucose isomerase [Anaerolineae bacterium]|nr:bifunctional transaldolase/phosoglucose isomerase [Anaerolineae bacterium]
MFESNTPAGLHLPDRRRLWFHDLSRALLAAQPLDALPVSSFTTHLVRLERAIGEGNAYDAALEQSTPDDAHSCFQALLAEDARCAADALRPRFVPEWASGVVSVDLSPLRAETPAQRLEAARQLFQAIGRPNVLIKLPAQPSLLTIIEQLLYEGVNVHFTHVYSAATYEAAAECYLRALERRALEKLPLNGVISVVSFHVSSLDAVVDRQLQNNIRAAQTRGELARVSANAELLGKIGVANANNVYRRSRDVYNSERFARLRAQGALPQRLLWTDIAPISPLQTPTHYLDCLNHTEALLLIEPTMLDKLADYEQDAMPRTAALREAPDILARLAAVGIDLDLVARQLVSDADEMYGEAFAKLIARVDGKRKLLSSGFMRRQTLVLGQYQKPVETELQRLRSQKSITRTWACDASLWTDSPTVAAQIQARLGWLRLPTDGRIDREVLCAARAESQRAGWQHIVMLGMGGANITAETLYGIFGQQAGFPALITLDSTDPTAIRDVESQIDFARTCFIVASKSGSTLETLAMLYYFYQRCVEQGLKAGDHFIAITDPETRLAEEAQRLGFRAVYYNPTDMAGRYAALSYFGMLPAAMLGLDFEKVLDRAAEMALACGANVMGNNHPGLWLGTVMGVLARRGLDKLTLITSPEIAAFGAWAEQLIAESSGKEDKGVIPISGGTVGLPHDYSDDRLIVYLRLENGAQNPDQAVQMLQEAGHPVVTLNLRDVYDIGAEFFRWQFAAATLGMVLGINPFDEPAVEESKHNTQRLLDTYVAQGALPHSAPAYTEDGVSLFADDVTAALLHQLRVQQAFETTPLSGMLAAFLRLARSGDYIGFLAYLPPRAEYIAQLEKFRRQLRHVLQRAVTLGFGPRYLHSTGQLHKAGCDKGVFIQLTVDDPEPLPIPNMPYSFSILKQAQAEGDYEALQSRGRRIIRLHLGAEPLVGLRKIEAAVEALAAKRK